MKHHVLSKGMNMVNKGVKATHMVLLIIAAVSLFLMSRINYLLFHLVIEGFSILVAVLIYVLALKTHRYSKNDYLTFVGIAYLFIGIVDFFHLISYDGMGVFSGLGPDPPTQLWIIARFLQAVSFVLAPAYLSRNLPYTATVLLYGLITGAGLISVLWLRVFPACFVAGRGLTGFKVIGEFIICALIAAGIWLLYNNSSLLEENIYKMMVISMIITIISELSFTLYSDVYGAMNFLGHVLKAVSFIIIYNGVIKVGIENPYDFIFRELKASSSTDYLTGLHNRDGFYEKVEKLAKLAMEKDTCVGILLVDFDNFKKMNDSYGHLFGDEVLKKFGILIRDIIRKEDIVCRFGGDEFILLTTAAEDELGKIKERLTGRVEEWIKSDERLRGLGLSMGLAVCKPGQELNIERLIEKADRDMYRNKKGKPGNGDELSEYFLS
ncbi:MAG TPA: hypothetical protein DCD97_07235 [Firmicutes bacterium]|jgi:diguanylate cyclase (GGDEF)-like protein|nr:hypothetical protein [Bacillota bacterium]